MKRTMLMYEKYAPEVEAIPAPADWENLIPAPEPTSFADFIPQPMALYWNGVTLHEWIGYFGYKWFRK